MGRMEPTLPHATEVDAHVLTHTPYRSWCVHCVRGRGQNDHHRAGRYHRAQDSQATVVMDYGFLRIKETDNNLQCGPLLVVNDTKFGNLTAFITPAKGAARPWIARRVASWTHQLGLGRITLKVDNEPAIVALAQEVAARRLELGATTLLENPPPGDSQSNSHAEAAVKQAEGMIRTVKDALEHRLAIVIPPTATIMHWLVEHATDLVSRYRVGSDGATPAERARGRRYARPTCEFGEAVLYMPLKAARPGKLEARFRHEMFCGLLRSGESIIGTDEGMLRARTVHRVPTQDRWKPEAVLRLKGFLYAPNGEGEAPIGIQVDLPPRVPSNNGLSPQDAEVVGRASGPRRVYIRKQDVEQFGATVGCVGCEALQIGQKSVGHSEACRTHLASDGGRTQWGRLDWKPPRPENGRRPRRRRSRPRPEDKRLALKPLGRLML